MYNTLLVSLIMDWSELDLDDLKDNDVAVFDSLLLDADEGVNVISDADLKIEVLRHLHDIRVAQVSETALLKNLIEFSDTNNVFYIAHFLNYSFYTTRGWVETYGYPPNYQLWGIMKLQNDCYGNFELRNDDVNCKIEHFIEHVFGHSHCVQIQNLAEQYYVDASVPDAALPFFNDKMIENINNTKGLYLAMHDGYFVVGKFEAASEEILNEIRMIMECV